MARLTMNAVANELEEIRTIMRKHQATIDEARTDNKKLAGKLAEAETIVKDRDLTIAYLEGYIARVRAEDGNKQDETIEKGLDYDSYFGIGSEDD